MAVKTNTLWKKQLAILGSIQTAGYNVVTCGDCGDLLLICMNEYEHKCIHCGFIGEHCDFPDWITDRSDYEIDQIMNKRISDH